MIEKQLIYKDKYGKKCIICGYYDKNDREFLFKFTEEELKDTFKDLGIAYKFKVVK